MRVFEWRGGEVEAGGEEQRVEEGEEWRNGECTHRTDLDG